MTETSGRRPILVGVGGSTASTAALKWAVAEAGRRDLPVLAVMVHLPQGQIMIGAVPYDALPPSGVGLQTDAPLKRAIMPAGGLRLVEAGLDAYGYKLDPVVKEIFTKYRKTHNDGMFDAYTAEILHARKAGIITGLPDAYGRWPCTTIRCSACSAAVSQACQWSPTACRPFSTPGFA
ncbi:nucleotide-binding universal stress UspA family protein [Kibdelosporangium banguiense]|uniref:Nucleotide-binding universal stress UspA family protein n=1 Tax=Kibdelosporangium banguiense TaxID=1365924 RepID=A0ABS4TXM8_9PSEU|nr:universal stress protein [Kibdelosporangium banguiense]MBP2328778.1 nucleotide-binding universal stress UspA family protein [Kibdelosporangium banguiense]